MYVNIYKKIKEEKNLFNSDYDQTGAPVNGAPWYYDKQSKRKKKLEGTLGVDPNAPTGDGTSK